MHMSAELLECITRTMRQVADEMTVKGERREAHARKLGYLTALFLMLLPLTGAQSEPSHSKNKPAKTVE